MTNITCAGLSPFITTSWRETLQVKNLIKKNYVILVDDRMDVTKVVGTPFSLLATRCCSHEAECLMSLARMGFESAPKFISSNGNSLTMERVTGRSLNGRRFIDEDLCLGILEIVHRLHGLGFAHGNLRRSNIFITDNNEPMLIDFETCCRESNPLFPLFKFSDQVRLHLLWHSAYVQPHRKRVATIFPKHVTLVMYLITPISRTSAVLKAIKKSMKRRFKQSRKLSNSRR
jgi:serine/threonine protein kinase